MSMREYKLWLAKLVTVILIVVLGLPIIGGLVATVEKVGGERVAVIELSGVIEDASDILKALYQEARHDDTKAIVLRVDSPGGAVAPSEEIYAAVKKLKGEKPIVVSMGSMAASGGLYSSLAASKIFCQPGTQTGSIGVIMQIPNFATIADKVGFSMITVKSGALKDAGNQFRPMTTEERAFLEGTANKVHDNFIKAVAEGRGIPETKVREFADGRVILGLEAKQLGLVDDFGDIYDAGRSALELAKVELKSDELPNLVFINRKRGFLSKLAEATSSLPSLVSSPVSGPTVRYLAY
jgi:protease-4